MIDQLWQALGSVLRGVLRDERERDSTAPRSGDAMLDRLLHRSVVFNMTRNSYRLRAHQARNRRHTTTGTPTTITPAQSGEPQ